MGTATISRPNEVAASGLKGAEPGANTLAGACTAIGLVGDSPAFRAMLDQLEIFAGADVPLLIAGETGTGKELVARIAHYRSRRADGPFVPINCGALPDHLFENELFGHGRGAFTDARNAQPGLVAHAEGGTLLLDEVECLDLHSQAALLRFLQDQQYRPLGTGKDVQAHVRVIASSNASLAERVALGQFRSDLLFRLDVARVEMPPLRERHTDILPLARSFVARMAERHQVAEPSITPWVAEAMLAYGWPGNVRELENAMHRAVLLAAGGNEISRPTWGNYRERARCCDVPAARPGFSGTLKAERARLNADFERRYLVALLERAHGNISAAAREAGTERRHLGRMIQRHGIEVAGFRG